VVCGCSGWVCCSGCSGYCTGCGYEGCAGCGSIYCFDYCFDDCHKHGCCGVWKAVTGAEGSGHAAGCRRWTRPGVGEYVE
jgi:hypothetical protein